MTRWTALLFVSGLAACASSGSSGGGREPAGPIEGDYEYVANIPGQQVLGRLRIVGDTMLVDPNNDYCRPVIGAPDPMYIRYTCNGPSSFEQLVLTLDRRNPVQFSRWSGTIRVRKQREVCVRYEIQQGRQVCVLTQMEPYETTESRSGRLQIRRAP
jgi:hypothetical protein